nr:MAG TPA: hypothetical protein [Caudoviricetes sp.]
MITDVLYRIKFIQWTLVSIIFDTIHLYVIIFTCIFI